MKYFCGTGAKINLMVFLLMLCIAWWTAEIRRERNWKDEEIEMLITLYEERPCLWDVGHKNYMNRDSKEVAYSQLDLLIFDKYDISREDYKSKWKSVYHCTHA